MRGAPPASPTATARAAWLTAAALALTLVTLWVPRRTLATEPREAIARFAVATPDADRARGADFAARARALRKRGDVRGALAAWRRAARWDPAITEAPAEAARAASELGRIDEAVGHAVLATRASDEFGRTTEAGALVRRLSQRAAQSQDWAAAQELCARRFELAPVGSADRRDAANSAASAAYLSDDYAAASEWFSRLTESLERAPAALRQTPPGLWDAVVAGHVGADRTDRAAAAIERLANSNPAPGHVALWTAAVAEADGRPTEALDAAQRALAEIDADSPRARLALAVYVEALGLTNQQDRAVVELRRLRRERPELVEGWFALVDALEAAELPREALDESAALLEAALDAAALDPDRGANLGTPDRTVRRAAAKQIELLAASTNAERLWRLVERLADEWQTLDPIRGTLDAAMIGDDGNPTPMAELAASWLARQQPDEASDARLLAGVYVAAAARRFALGEPLLKESFARPWAPVSPNSSSDAAAPTAEWIDYLRVDRASHWSAAATEAGEPLIGAAAIELALNRRDGFVSQNPTLHRYLGDLLSKASSVATDPAERDQLALRAIKAIDEARRLAPQSIYAATGKAWVLATLNRRDEAVADALAVIAKFDSPASPLTDPADREVINRLRSYATILLDGRDLPGDAELGDELLEQVLDTQPLAAGARNDLAYRWTERRTHLDRALRMAREGVEAEPENGAFWDTLGWAEHRYGRHTEGAASLARAVRLAEAGPMTADDAVLYEHWAAALEATGDHLAAEAARARGLRLTR
ncbi:MAG: tetratricopeptide repeat protein [Lacipirellulaceae bacterium]